MKLECSVVRDLYVLYKEKELSKEVQEAVDQHLKNCENCTHIYEEEWNISDILKKEPAKQPSKNWTRR